MALHIKIWSLRLPLSESSYEHLQEVLYVLSLQRKSKLFPKLLTFNLHICVGWWGNTHTHITWIYFGNGVKCPQQCHYDSLFATYVSSFITVHWICDFVFSPPASMQVHCAHMEERDVVWDASMEAGWRVCIIICSSALAFGNWDMGGKTEVGREIKYTEYKV